MKTPKELLPFQEFLTPDEMKSIRSESFHMEQSGRLTPPILDLIYKKKWLASTTPDYCIGLTWSLPRIVRLFETLAYAEGNLGWCVNLGAGANLFSGFLPTETVHSIFQSPQTWCAGSGAISGQATATEGGYLLTGKWKYASGSAHATHFTANAFIVESSEGKKNSSSFKSFIFPKEKVKIIEKWTILGLRATNSNSFEVNQLFVPQSQAFSLAAPSVYNKNPLYHFPFNSMAVVNIAAALSGMAFHFLELVEELMKNKFLINKRASLKEEDSLRQLFSEQKDKLTGVRTEMYALLEEAWKQIEKESLPNPEKMEKLTSKARELVSSIKEMVYHLSPYCGMNLLFEGERINKVWRDLTTAGQHFLFSPMAK